ncbi:MAG: aldo/keto reductase [Bacilli bacterium]|nr:aldo/keto reductase [Bacilli bacterium]MBN2876888.1 aldo/keto reductase [Bacilli bacterium]
MKYRSLGQNESVSILGFGCMRLPVVNEVYADIDETEATKQIRYAIDNGVNYIDTAYPYHGENSEAFVGRALQDGYRDKVFLATKCPSWLIKTREDMDKYLDIQLERLQTDYIDYYLLHALNKNYWENYKKLGVWDFIDKALESGKIKHIGFSFHDEYPVFEDILTSYDWDFCQIQMNYFDEDYQAGLKGLKLAGKRNIDVIIMEPLRGGRLAEQGPGEIQAIWQKAENKHSSAGWALRYLWNYPEVKTILSGMNNMDHIKENIKEAEKAKVNMLTEDEKALINEVKHVYKSRIQVDCTNCKYCMPCPHGVDIPANFAFYNNAFVFDDKEHFKTAFRNQLKPESWADACQKCGECEPKCPQQIEIIQELERVADYFIR